jgi:hypothetical protein
MITKVMVEPTLRCDCEVVAVESIPLLVGVPLGREGFLDALLFQID